jgi:hypothetical protein
MTDKELRNVSHFILTLRDKIPAGIPHYQLPVIVSQLVKVAKRLNHFHEARCNRKISPREETAHDRCRAKAQELAESLGLKAFIQGDPRGMPLYLVPKTLEHPECSYPTDGIVVPI